MTCFLTIAIFNCQISPSTYLSVKDKYESRTETADQRMSEYLCKFRSIDFLGKGLSNLLEHQDEHRVRPKLFQTQENLTFSFNLYLSRYMSLYIYISVSIFISISIYMNIRVHFISTRPDPHLADAHISIEMRSLMHLQEGPAMLHCYSSCTSVLLPPSLLCTLPRSLLQRLCTY